MSDTSKIEWTDATWNPVTGCSKVSQGCKNCYALREWPRISAPAKLPDGSIDAKPRNRYTFREFTDVRCHPELLDAPLRWSKPRRIFVNSMSDLFHEDVPFQFIADVFAVMACTTRHTYQVLTKRPARMLEWFAWLRDEHDPGLSLEKAQEWFGGAWPAQVQPTKVWPSWLPHHGKGPGYDNCGPLWPLVNVWLGVSVEDQATADERIPLLLQTPTAVRFISAEPLLGPVNLLKWKIPGHTIARALSSGKGEPCLHWVIAGGESGPNARPTHPDWIRSLRDQCAAAGAAFFFKQWGEWEEVAPDWRDDDGEHHQVNVPSAEAEDWFVDGDKRNCLLAPDGTAYYYKDRIPDEVKCRLMNRAGKRSAGRLLDGRTHDEYPA